MLTGLEWENLLNTCTEVQRTTTRQEEGVEICFVNINGRMCIGNNDE